MARIRERWGSKLGIILAVAGSAVGLGNFLRFPSQAAQNGGGAFMIPYLIALILIGIPLMWAEWTAGRFGGVRGHSSAPGIFQSLWPKNGAIKYIGVAGIMGPFLIYIYYVYIESWCLAYAYYSLVGKLDFSSAEAYVGFLQWYQGVGGEGLAGSAPGFIFFLITFAINISVAYFGIRGGIEKMCNIALPTLFFFAVVIAIRVLTLDAPPGAPADQNAIGGLGFLWNPDLTALKSPKVWLAAAGQIFFTLSVGMGVILTYASYLRQKDDVALSGLTAASTNEFAEIVLGGSIVIPAAFVFFGAVNLPSVAASGTFNLGFVTMPQIFAGVPGGFIYGFMWFFMLFLAGITSSISLAQPMVAFMEDEFKMTRQKAVPIFAIVSFILCQPAIWFLSKGVLDDLDFWGGTFFIVIGATFEIILLGWVFGIDKTWKELHQGAHMRVPRIFKFVIKYISSTLLLAMLGWWFYDQWWDVITMRGIADDNMPYVLGMRLVLLGILVVLLILIGIAFNRKRNNTNEARS
ncbi:MAG: sodium-dependent transporter [candidate division Zixibacteria bacterium]|nr:sodium-dependent transporter [candidate division Zixibacteria bacterium]